MVPAHHAKHPCLIPPTSHSSSLREICPSPRSRLPPPPFSTPVSATIAGTKSTVVQQLHIHPRLLAHLLSMLCPIPSICLNSLAPSHRLTAPPRHRLLTTCSHPISNQDHSPCVMPLASPASTPNLPPLAIPIRRGGRLCALPLCRCPKILSVHMASWTPTHSVVQASCAKLPVVVAGSQSNPQYWMAIVSQYLVERLHSNSRWSVKSPSGVNRDKTSSRMAPSNTAFRLNTSPNRPFPCPGVHSTCPHTNLCPPQKVLLPICVVFHPTSCRSLMSFLLSLHIVITVYCLFPLDPMLHCNHIHASPALLLPSHSSLAGLAHINVLCYFLASPYTIPSPCVTPLTMGYHCRPTPYMRVI